jgi:hypothetical protein
LTQKVFTIGYLAISILFVGCAAALVVFACLELWVGINPGSSLRLPGRFNRVLESIGLLTIAVVALELGQTIVEEEVRREAQLSAPTRVRRFLSRFLVVIVIALAIECLVATFQLVHENPSRLPQAATTGVAAAALLAAWGIFVRLNRDVEDLEPEQMAQVKQEDREIEQAQDPRESNPQGRG